MKTFIYTFIFSLEELYMINKKCLYPLWYFSFAICLAFQLSAQETHDISTYVSEHGLGELKMVFEPGIKVNDLEVRKTFQPSYVVTSKGTLIVFCQGRLYAGADNDPKVILVNRSLDMGKTWEGVEVISNPMNFFAISPYATITDDGIEKISFLTCVGLKVTKKFYDHDVDLLRESTGIDLEEVGSEKTAVLCQYVSEDDGKSWERDFLPGDKTPLYKNYNGFTPVFINVIGQVHQIHQGIYAGRMIIAVPVYAVPDSIPITDNFRNHPCSGSGIIYSDDHGETWKMDGMISDFIGNEASAVSVENGESILMIRRFNQPNRKVENPLGLEISIETGKRMASKSYDGGRTWTDPFFVDISEILCHGTLARVQNRLYFSIPNGLEDKDEEKEQWDDDRIRGAIYYSEDEGVSWKYKIIEPDYFSYSTVGKLKEDYLITFFSRGGHGRYGIGYRIFTDRWLDSFE
jgi:sialidase-1